MLHCLMCCVHSHWQLPVVPTCLACEPCLAAWSRWQMASGSRYYEGISAPKIRKGDAYTFLVVNEDGSGCLEAAQCLPAARERAGTPSPGSSPPSQCWRRGRSSGHRTRCARWSSGAGSRSSSHCGWESSSAWHSPRLLWLAARYLLSGKGQKEQDDKHRVGQPQFPWPPRFPQQPHARWIAPQNFLLFVLTSRALSSVMSNGIILGALGEEGGGGEREREYHTKQGVPGKLTNKYQWAWPLRLGRDLDHFFVATHFGHPLLWGKERKTDITYGSYFYSLCINLRSQVESILFPSFPWVSCFYLIAVSIP